MKKGICIHSIIPIRSSPSERSEMVSQLLFGELYDILEEKDDFFLIRSFADQYEGWMNKKMSLFADEDTVIRCSGNTSAVISLTGSCIDQQNGDVRHLVRGSLLPGYDDRLFYVNDRVFSFEGSVTGLPSIPDPGRLEEIALLYLNTPYLWGGRTPFGIDCSGFVQIVFRNTGIRLPRDASQQSRVGYDLSFIDEALPGDLAFFDTEEGVISHVGILLGQGRIIHASGSVRIDTIDHHGIFNLQSGCYTHKLRLVKRLFPDV